jgi:hypothetical protein
VPSKAAGRFWELSGGLIRCGGCGYIMFSQNVKSRSGKVFHYYRCSYAARNGRKACLENKMRPAEAAESEVWERVRAFMRDPEGLREDLERMIELKREEGRADPAREARVWTQKLTEVSTKRAGYLDLAASGRMTYDELDAKLADLDGVKETAERELAALREHAEEIARLEEEKDLVLDHYAELAPDALEALKPAQRHALYGMLRVSGGETTDGPLEVSLPLRTDVCNSSSTRLYWRSRSPLSRLSSPRRGRP